MGLLSICLAACSRGTIAIFELDTQGIAWTSPQVRQAFLDDPMWQPKATTLRKMLRSVKPFNPPSCETEFRRYAASGGKIPLLISFLLVAIFEGAYTDHGEDPTLPPYARANAAAVRSGSSIAFVLLAVLFAFLVICVIALDLAPGVETRHRYLSKLKLNVQRYIAHMWAVLGLVFVVHRAAAHALCSPRLPVDPSSVTQAEACINSFSVIHSSIIGFNVFFVADPLRAALACAVILLTELLSLVVLFPFYDSKIVALRLVFTSFFSIELLCMSGVRAIASRKYFRAVVVSHICRVEEMALRSRVGELVSSVLPPKMVRRAARLIDDPLPLWDVQPLATVCVTEAVDFAKFCMQLRDIQACCAIHHLFTLFDKAAPIFGVDVATTLGDMFVCTAGLASVSTGAGHALRFALWQLRLPETEAMPLRSIVVTGMLEGGIAGDVSKQLVSSLRYVIGGPAVDEALAMLPNVGPDELWLSPQAVRSLDDADKEVLVEPFAAALSCPVPGYLRLQSLVQPDASRTSMDLDVGGQTTAAILDDFEGDAAAPPSCYEGGSLTVIAAQKATASSLNPAESSVGRPSGPTELLRIGLVAFDDPQTELLYRRTAATGAAKIQSIAIIVLALISMSGVIVGLIQSGNPIVVPASGKILWAFIAVWLLCAVLCGAVVIINMCRKPILLPYQVIAVVIVAFCVSSQVALNFVTENDMARNDPLFFIDLFVPLLTTFAMPALPWLLQELLGLLFITGPMSYIYIYYAADYPTAIASSFAAALFIADLNRSGRMTWAAIRRAMERQRAAAEAAARLRQLFDGLIPEHVIGRGIQRLDAIKAKAQGKARRRHESDSATMMMMATTPREPRFMQRLRELRETCATKWFVDIIDCFDEFIICAVKLDYPLPCGNDTTIGFGGTCSPRSVRLLWQAVGRAVATIGGKSIRVVDTLGDHVYVGGPFPEAEDSVTNILVPGGGATSAVNLERPVAEADDVPSLGTPLDGLLERQAGQRHYKPTRSSLFDAARRITNVLAHVARLSGMARFPTYRVCAGLSCDEGIGGLMGNETLRYKVLGAVERQSSALVRAAVMIAQGPASVLRNAAPIRGRHVVLATDNMAAILSQSGVNNARLISAPLPWRMRGMPYRRPHYVALVDSEPGHESSAPSASGSFWPHSEVSSFGRTLPRNLRPFTNGGTADLPDVDSSTGRDETTESSEWVPFVQSPRSLAP